MKNLDKYIKEELNKRFKNKNLPKAHFVGSTVVQLEGYDAVRRDLDGNEVSRVRVVPYPEELAEQEAD